MSPKEDVPAGKAAAPRLRSGLEMFLDSQAAGTRPRETVRGAPKAPPAASQPSASRPPTGCQVPPPSAHPQRNMSGLELYLQAQAAAQSHPPSGHATRSASLGPGPPPTPPAPPP
eukprot:EG_transcript_54364